MCSLLVLFLNLRTYILNIPVPIHQTNPCSGGQGSRPCRRKPTGTRLDLCSLFCCHGFTLSEADQLPTRRRRHRRSTPHLCVGARNDFCSAPTQHTSVREVDSQRRRGSATRKNKSANCRRVRRRVRGVPEVTFSKQKLLGVNNEWESRANVSSAQRRGSFFLRAPLVPGEPGNGRFLKGTPVPPKINTHTHGKKRFRQTPRCMCNSI